MWEQLRSSYDRVAPSYEDRFRDELAGKPLDRELLRAFANSVVDPVADMGCGPGHVGAFVRQCGRWVVGVDFSVPMAKLASGRLDTSIAADLRRLPVRSGQLGGLVAFYSLIHVPRPGLGAALSEIHRVLRPGGRALLSAHEGQGQVQQHVFLGEPVPFVATLFDLDELAAAAREAGLAVRTARRRAPYPSEHPTVRLYIEAERATE